MKGIMYPKSQRCKFQSFNSSQFRNLNHEISKSLVHAISNMSMFRFSNTNTDLPYVLCFTSVFLGNMGNWSRLLLLNNRWRSLFFGIAVVVFSEMLVGCLDSGFLICVCFLLSEVRVCTTSKNIG